MAAQHVGRLSLLLDHLHRGPYDQTGTWLSLEEMGGGNSVISVSDPQVWRGNERYTNPPWIVVR